MRGNLPSDEAKRLQALHDYRILDTPPEIAFERLTALAAKLFEAPIALISLIDSERQWIKACFGIDVEQTERQHSFCTHTILSNEVMIVPDATQDSRFNQNPFVIGTPHIRFYAGAPLPTEDGHNIGSLCVLDTVSRPFDDEQRAMLIHLADIVMDELVLHRAARELRENESILRQALRENSQLAVAIANIMSGVVVTNHRLPDNPIVFANAGFYKMTGYSEKEIMGRNCRFLQGAQTDSNMVSSIRQAIAEQREFQGILLNYRKDGTSFSNELILSPVFDEAGELMSYVGLQNDVTEREQARQLLEKRVEERTADLADSQIEILSRLAMAAEYRDDDTGQHTHRVARTAALLAEELGLPAEQVSFLYQAAPLHDVGKIAISDLILLKPGKLTDEEFVTMKTHASIGAAMLADGHSEVVQMAERIAGSHHERYDGRGYPNHLAGEEIPIEGRILAVADVFDALTHERPYKKAWLMEAAVEEIRSQSGKQFDPKVVEAFLQLNHADLL